MLKLSDLARRSDVQIGPLLVSPSRRLVEGPEGRTHLEPLIMQVFLLLLDAEGKVVTRNELFDQCWGGVVVGDDSLNRAIARVRRASAEVAPGFLEIETIPRTGYRLSGQIEPHFSNAAKLSPGSEEDTSTSRRKFISGAIAVSAGAAAIGAWRLLGNRPDPRAAELLRSGEQAMRLSLPEANAIAVKALRDATRVDPSNARAWGLLALALRDITEEADPAEVSKAVLDTETAARRALAIDSKEANARTALATVRPEFGNWGQTEDSLRAILQDSPDNVDALSYLVMILQAVGRARESWDLNERAIALDPLAPVLLFRRGLKLWILGRVPEADLAIDRALQLWPKHPAVWNARLYIFAFTGRAGAALAALDDASQRPERFRKPAIDYWRHSLRALDSGSREDVKEAVRINLEAAPTSPYFATSSMMVLSMLNELDSAFAVADGTLLRRGPLIGSIWAGKNTMAVHDQYWRRTMNLFTPATAAMRADPRFKSLCDGIGMTNYWRKRGIGPDATYNLAAL